MEKKLKKLFDYQRFEKNERLEKIINETENQYGEELTDYDLSLIDAAGEINPPRTIPFKLLLNLKRNVLLHCRPTLF